MNQIEINKNKDKNIECIKSRVYNLLSDNKAKYRVNGSVIRKVLTDSKTFTPYQLALKYGLRPQQVKNILEDNKVKVVRGYN